MPNIDTTSYVLLAAIVALAIGGVVASVLEARKPKPVQLSRELSKLPRIALLISAWMLVSFPTGVVSALVDWRFPGSGVPLRWAMVGGASAGLLLAVFSRASRRVMPIALVLSSSSLLTALGVLVVAIGAPGGAARRNVLEFSGWSCLLLLALGCALRYRFLLRGQPA
jgi:hypothetical protein